MYSDLSLALHSLTDKYCAHMFYLTFWGIRCFCSNCSVDLATKAEECQCCQEIDRCGKVMEQFGDPKRCITFHPGFEDVCLSKHVLEVAALGSLTKHCFFKVKELKRSKFTSYTTVLTIFYFMISLSINWHGTTIQNINFL